MGITTHTVIHCDGPQDLYQLPACYECAMRRAVCENDELKDLCHWYVMDCYDSIAWVQDKAAAWAESLTDEQLIDAYSPTFVSDRLYDAARTQIIEPCQQSYTDAIFARLHDSIERAFAANIPDGMGECVVSDIWDCYLTFACDTGDGPYLDPQDWGGVEQAYCDALMEEIKARGIEAA